MFFEKFFREADFGNNANPNDDPPNQEDTADYTADDNAPAEDANQPAQANELTPADPAGNDEGGEEATDYTLPDDDAGDQAAPAEEAPAQNTPTEDAPVEDTGGDTNEQPPADDANTGDQANPDANEAPSGEDAGSDEGTTDYTQDSGTEGGEGDADAGGDSTGEDDTAGDDAGGDDATDDTSANDGDDELKNLENELFSDLTPEQIAIKHKELKDKFMQMYDVINSVIDRVNDTPKSEEFISTFDFVSNKLSELKDLITDYISETYPTKTYMENAIMYNNFLATLHGIQKILDEVAKKTVSDQE